MWFLINLAMNKVAGTRWPKGLADNNRGLHSTSSTMSWWLSPPTPPAGGGGGLTVVPLAACYTFSNYTTFPVSRVCNVEFAGCRVHKVVWGGVVWQPCTLHTAHCEHSMLPLHTAHCTLPPDALCTMHSTHGTLRAQHTSLTAHGTLCTLNTAHGRLRSAECTLHTLYTAQCTRHTADFAQCSLHTTNREVCTLHTRIQTAHIAHWCTVYSAVGIWCGAMYRVYSAHCAKSILCTVQ